MSDELASLKHKLTLVRDRVKGVVHGWATGLYLWGNGGTSKTWTVEQSLKELKANFKVTKGRLTAKGLFELLEDRPTAVHVLDDLESMFSDKISHGVLRSALWGTENKRGINERQVVWHTGTKRSEFTFTGGIIMVANMPLDRVPTLEALKTRIAEIHHKPTDAELIALMRFLADQGYTYKGHVLTAHECNQIVDEVVDMLCHLSKPIDMRLFVNGRMDRLQYKCGMSETHWLDLLESRVKGRAVDIPRQVNRPNLKVV